jgi:hypothetical protein
MFQCRNQNSVIESNLQRADYLYYDSDRAAQTLRAALSSETAQGRLLDNFECSGPHGHFSISSEGSIEHFKGRENITVNGTLAYALDYMGGLIKP